MRLTRLELRNFRRSISEDLDLSEPLVALTGPNESGKSSLLRAIQLLDESEEIELRDVTRGYSLPSNDVLLRGLFRLDEGDKSSISHIAGAEQARHFVLNRHWDGTITTAVQPLPRRPMETIDEAIRIAARTTARLTRPRKSPAPATVIETFRTAGRALERYRDEGWDRDDNDETLGDLRLQLQSALEDSGLEGALLEAGAEVVSAIVRAEEARGEEHPHAAMRRLLYERRPRFIPFVAEERDLRGSYDLSTAAASSPPALANIAALARVNVVALRDARSAGDYGRVEGLLDEANEQLKEAMRTWSQSSLTLRLRMDENILRLLVTTPNRSWLTDITERSDGLRSYIALIGAIAWARRSTHSQRPTVLLLDEAEQHLHYDAQADLVEVLSSGQLASQVVYTTHSAGCLPEDLGAGVRVILPAANAERSTIQNWFWEAGPGFSPLLLGMGASSLAFTSARRAVLTEGASDTIALPSLLREAVGTDRLGYQVAPGLAQVGREAARDLDLEAARVIYLVDGDQAGRGIKKKLQSAGVPSNDIVALGGESSGMTLEDLLSATAFRAAVEATFRRSGQDPNLKSIPAPRIGRASALRAACEAVGVAPPSKRVLAQEIVILARSSSVLSMPGAAVLRRLHATIADRLRLPQATQSQA